MKLLIPPLLLIAICTPLSAQNIYQWDGSSSGGDWSTGTNWSPDAATGGPGSSDTATLDNVVSGTRSIIYDAGTGGTLGTLQLNQSSAGAINLLDIQRSLTVTNAVSLGAVAGLEKIIVESAASGANTLTIGGAGLSLATNGELALTRTSGGAGNITGDVSLSGGTLRLTGSASGSGNKINTITGALTMTSGSIIIENSGTGIEQDRRLSITGNVNISGGSVAETLGGLRGTLELSGDTLVYNPTSSSSGLILSLQRFGNQSLTTNKEPQFLVLRGSGVKTLTRTEGNTIRAIELIDANSSTSVGTSLKLGSDLTLASGAALPKAASYSQSGTSLQFGIDTNGHTLNLASGASGGVWTPNSGGVATTWTLSGNGTIAAAAFVFNSASVSTEVGSGLTLEARGGAGTANILSGTGAIAADSTFRYSGNATSVNPATLTSNRAIGRVEVTSGALLLDTVASVKGSTRVTAGTLLLGTAASLNDSPTVTLGAAGTLDTTAQATFVMLSSQQFVFTLDPTGSGLAGRINASGLNITNGVVSITTTGTLDDAVYILATYTSLTGTSFSLVNGVPSGYMIDYSYLGNQIALVAVPEPMTLGSLVCGLAVVAISVGRGRTRGGNADR